jgi:uncharacterized membrane protein
MTKRVYIGTVVLLLVPYITAQPTETTTITIQLDTTGSALWTVESRLVLATEEDEKFFEEFQKDETLKDSRLSEFKSKMNLLLEKIKYSRQRSMTMADFDIFLGKEITVTKTYGVIQFRFTWEGFAVIEDDRIIMGDVFEGGYYLSRNEILMVNLPEGYDLVTAAPVPDHQKQAILIWEGPMNFASGEPAVIVEKGTREQAGEEPTSRRHIGEEMLIPIVLGLALISVFAVIIKFRRRENQEERKPQYLDDKKLIIDTVKKHGGAIAQKKLPDLTGFSKAKVSILLSELKEEGLIRKTFRGRENQIRLSEENS